MFVPFLERQTTSVFLKEENFPKWAFVFHLLHSKQPKLYGVLAVLSAKRLKKEFALIKHKIYLY